MASALDPVRLAELLGSRPFLLFAVLAGLLVAALGLLVAVVRWAAGHARRLWRVAETGWRRLADLPPLRRLQRRYASVFELLHRLTAAEYLLLHLALGLALALAALGFSGLAEAVTGEEAIVQVDLAVARSLHAAADPPGIATLRTVTMLGSGWALAVLGLVVAAELIRRRERILAIGWVVAVAGAGILNAVLKAGFQRARPAFADPISVADGWSFPSGHAMGTMVTIGMLAYLGFFPVRSTAGRVLLVAAAMVWILLMGFTRMYLGVHYLSDVLAGYAAGTVWLTACISGVEVARRRTARAGRRDGGMAG